MGVASQPVSERVLEAAQINGGELTAEHFQIFSELHELTPDLRQAPDGIGLVRLYYHAICALGAVAGKFFPSIAEWSERERFSARATPQCRSIGACKPTLRWPRPSVPARRTSSKTIGVLVFFPFNKENAAALLLH